MTQKDKELLLQDLCARLPYGVKCSFGVDDAVYEITGINPTCCGASEIQATHVKSSINGDFRLNSCKPYLFPLSSMTEEQTEEIHNLIYQGISESVDETKEWLKTRKENDLRPITLTYILSYKLVIDWFCKNHFDYRDLIPKGLAIDATNLNIY